MNPFGAIAGAVTDLGFGIYDRVSAKSQNDRTYNLSRNAFKNRVKDARKMGISPLAALGMSAGSPSVTVPTGSNFSGAMSNLSRELMQSQLDASRATADKTKEEAKGQKILNAKAMQDLQSKNAPVTQDGVSRYVKIRTPSGIVVHDTGYDPKVTSTAYGDDSFVNDLYGGLQLLKDLYHTGMYGLTGDMPNSKKSRKKPKHSPARARPLNNYRKIRYNNPHE